MAISFPTNPTFGQTFFDGTRTWTFDGVRWSSTTFTGYTGSLGFGGFIGSIGFRGSLGFQGSFGFQGSVGFQGTVGFKGSAGDPGGPRGYTGSAATVGKQLALTIIFGGG